MATFCSFETIFDQVFDAEVRLRRAQLLLHETPAFVFENGHALAWPADFDRISSDLFVKHVQYIRDEDNEFLGEPVKRAIWEYLKHKRNNNSLIKERIQVRKIQSGPRKGLIGQDGVFSAMPIAKGTILIEYGGLVKTQRRHQEHVLQLDWPMADERAMLLNGTCDWTSDESLPLLIDGCFHGNIGGKFNDGRFNPFDRPPSKSVEPSVPKTSKANEFSVSVFRPINKDSKEVEGYCNCRFVEVVLFGWPHVFVMTSEDIAADTELTTDYGENFWDTVRLHNSFGDLFKNTQSSLGSGTSLLNSLAEFVSKL